VVAQRVTTTRRAGALRYRQVAGEEKGGGGCGLGWHRRKEAREENGPLGVKGKGARLNRKDFEFINCSI
jgi:hypothetical protein